MLHGSNNGAFALIPKSMGTQDKIDKLDFIKLKVCASNGTVMKRRHTVCQQIITGCASDKELVSTICK